MDPDEHRPLLLTLHESMILSIGLDCYLREFQAHRGEDGGASHPEAEWKQMQREVADVQSRLRQLRDG